jgi:dTDP-4-dehydrorhamnose reductase
MNVFIVGCNGQLGSDMVRVGRSLGHAVECIDFPDIDITRADSIAHALGRSCAQAIINCTGYTAVDEAERNRDKAFAVNRDGVANLAAAARERKTLLVHFGTDYVFDGTATQPYVEDDACSPRTVYGQSKRAGESVLAAVWPQHQILRIAWLYGATGGNFVKAILKAAGKAAAAGTPLRVVNDQQGSPTWTEDVCRQTYCLVGTQETGIFHATSEGRCTWFDFASRIVKRSGLAAQVVPCTTAEFPRPAERPAWSVLENRRLKRLGLNVMPHWEQAFDAFWAQCGEAVMKELA